MLMNQRYPRRAKTRQSLSPNKKEQYRNTASELLIIPNYGPLLDTIPSAISSFWSYLYGNKRRDHRRRLVTEGSRRVLPLLEGHAHLLRLVLRRFLRRLKLERRRRGDEGREEGDGNVPVEWTGNLEGGGGPALQAAGLVAVIVRLGI